MRRATNPRPPFRRAHRGREMRGAESFGATGTPVTATGVLQLDADCVIRNAATRWRMAVKHQAGLDVLMKGSSICVVEEKRRWCGKGRSDRSPRRWQPSCRRPASSASVSMRAPWRRRCMPAQQQADRGGLHGRAASEGVHQRDAGEDRIDAAESRIPQDQ